MNREQSGDDGNRRETASRVGPVSTDELFALLSHPDNRYVLTYLLLEDDPVSLVDLVEYVLDVTESPEDVPRAEFGGQVLNRFIETTLPRLDERGLIEYDRSSQMVRETEATTLTLPYLRAGLAQSDIETPERRS